MYFPLILLAVGCLALSAGLYQLHHVDKDHPLFKRITAVVGTMTGCVLIWSALAYSTPPILNEDVKVTKIGKDWMVLKLTYNPVRNCKTEQFSTIFIFGNNRIELPAVFITGGEARSQDNALLRKQFVYIGIVNTTGMVPDKYFINATHQCALGFEFSTEFPIEDVPELFTEEEVLVPLKKQYEALGGV